MGEFVLGEGRAFHLESVSCPAYVGLPVQMDDTRLQISGNIHSIRVLGKGMSKGRRDQGWGEI